jgi:hypothetical protein
LPCELTGRLAGPSDQRIGILVGLWQAGSTWYFGVPTEALFGNAAFGGPLIAIAAAMSVVSQCKGVSSGISVVLGAWMIAPPYTFGFSIEDIRLWNYVIVGALAAEIATLTLPSSALAHTIRTVHTTRPSKP